MKRFLLILLLGVSCGLALFAQKENLRNELYFGAGGGGVMASVDFVPSIQQTPYYLYQGGIAAKYISEKHLGLVTELNLTRKGWREEFTSSDDFSYERALTYIDIPFMTHVYFGNNTRFIINAGPQVSVLIGENSTMSQALADDLNARREANPTARIGVQYSSMSEMKRVDYGLIGGIGMELRTGIGIFNIEGRYYFGLGDIFPSSRSGFSRSAHRTIAAKLTYYIRIR